jgi:hypothetical protein
MSHASEKLHSVRELAWLSGMSERFIRDRIREGAFGPEAVYNLNGDLRIKASAWNAYLKQHELPAPAPGIFARSEGELRRKIAQQEKNAA